jgi:hypothetical protein
MEFNIPHSVQVEHEELHDDLSSPRKYSCDMPHKVSCQIRGCTLTSTIV